MASNFHFGTRGPSPCSAKPGGCPFGGDSGSENHFDTLAEASTAYEKKHNNKSVRSISKDSMLTGIHSDQAILEASKEDVSRSTLIALSKHEDPAVRIVVGSSPKSSVSILRRLASDPDEQTRASVASNPNTPEENLIKLTQDKKNLVVISAVINPKTPKSAIDKIEIDKSLSVASAIASNNNGNVSIRMFKKLSKIDDNEVQSRLASNSQAPDSVVAHAIVGARQANELMENHPNPPSEAVEAAWEVHSANGSVIDLSLYTDNDSTPESVRLKIDEYSKVGKA